MVILRKDSCHLRPILWRLPCCEEAQVNCIETLLGKREREKERKLQFIQLLQVSVRHVTEKAMGWDNLRE